MFKHYLITGFVFAVLQLSAFSQTHKAPPPDEEVQKGVRRELDSMAQKMQRFFTNHADVIIQDLRASNDSRRDLISPLYTLAFHREIPATAANSAADPGEVSNLVEEQLFPEAWKKLIETAPEESSDYITKGLKPALTDPRADRAAVERIQRTASDAWKSYKALAAEKFSREANRINNDFEKKLSDLAREHKDLREALGALCGVPIPPNEFDGDFQKYITLAEAKTKPTGSASPEITQTPSPKMTPASNPPEPASTAVPTAVRAEKRPLEPGVPPEPGTEDFSAQLKDQKQTLDAVKSQAQNLDNNYPILHHELSGQIEALSTQVFWLWLVVIVLGIALVGSIVTAISLAKRNDAQFRRK